MGSPTELAPDQVPDPGRHHSPDPAETTETPGPSEGRRRLQVVPARWSTITFVLLLSGLMTLIVSGISTARNLGVDDGFVGDWLSAFASSWPVTFPTALVVIPLVRRIVAAVVVPVDPASPRPERG
ncbi:MAG: DUF2798 domain-containing protein [Actinomycetota bacterium]